MEKFIVQGGKKLAGEFIPSGNKNEALSVIASALLTKSKVTISNVPNIGDVVTMRSLIKSIGATEKVIKPDQICIDSSTVTSFTPNPLMVSQIRGSFLLIAPLLLRFGRVIIPTPGGDSIGRRRLDTHFLALKKLGAQVEVLAASYDIRCDKLVGADIFLDEASVMATENAIMAAVMAHGETVIYNAACEPHVQGLCRMLNSMGAKISGISSNRLLISGVSSLAGTQHAISYDHIEIGSILGLAAVTGSAVTIKKGALADLGLIDFYFEKLGVSYQRRKEDIFISADQKMRVAKDDRLRVPKIDDAPWPGFPSDLLSIMLVVAVHCQGSVLIFEKLFESRLFWIDKIISMGAEVILCDPHRALVNGPARLYGQSIVSPDIRAGMALLIAAISAEGKSEIFNIEQIDRGYENIDIKLRQLGVDIKRVSV